MFVENLDDETRSAIFESFFSATKSALMSVFDKSEDESSDLIHALARRFADRPTREQNLLLHDDPVALASVLAEVPWTEVDVERLEAFNRDRRQCAPSEP